MQHDLVLRAVTNAEGVMTVQVAGMNLVPSALVLHGPDERPVELGEDGTAVVILSGLQAGPYTLRATDKKGAVLTTERIHVAERPVGKDFFPVVCQFTSVPAGPGPRNHYRIGCAAPKSR